MPKRISVLQRGLMPRATACKCDAKLLPLLSWTDWNNSDARCTRWTMSQIVSTASSVTSVRLAIGDTWHIWSEPGRSVTHLLF